MAEEGTEHALHDVSDPSCVICRYWRRTTGDEGECHRYPPVPEREDLEFEAKWPKTETIDWCGEYLHQDLADWRDFAKLCDSTT